MCITYLVTIITFRVTCVFRGQGRQGGGTFLFNRRSKNLLRQPYFPLKSEKSFDTYVNFDSHENFDLKLADLDSSETDSVNSSDENEVWAIIVLKGEILSYVNILFDNKSRRKALIDTGSCANAIPENLLDLLENSNVKYDFTQASLKNVQ